MQSDIVDVLKDLAVSLGWTFSYGNRANHNLIRSSLDDNQIYLLLDPVRTSQPSDEFGGEKETVFTGNFILGIQSTIDKTYEEKYEDNIKPLKNNELPKIKNLLNCGDYQLNGWSFFEDINLYDTNLDGLVVTYSIAIL